MLRQTHLTSTLLVLVNLSMLVLGCEIAPTQSPTLCLFTTTELAEAQATSKTIDCPDPQKVATDEDLAPTRCSKLITADDVLHIRHTLPDGVSPSGPLSLRVETPCGAKTYEVPYIDGLALWSSEAPVGADCSISIATVLDNSELRCVLDDVNTAACANVCPDESTP